MAVLFSFAASIQAAEVTETITMKGFAGSKATSYENVTKTGASDLGTEMVAYAFNPSNGQVRGNKTAIAGASVTTADNAKNWSLYNSQAMPGAIKSIKVTQTATGDNKFINNLYVALGTTNQGAVTTVTGAQKSTTSTASEFTFDIDETQGYTYFKLLSNAKFTSNSVAGVVVTVTYVTAEEDPDATKYTVTTKVNDETMGTVTGAGEYAEGKTATLTANPNAGYRFVNWSNGSTDNPLKITVTENVEITANFEAVPPMTCAEAAAAASGATVVLNPFDVVYVVKGAGYIYIEDESGVNLIYDFNLDDQLKAGDHVEGFVGVSSPYNGLPELKPSVAFADLTVTPGTAPEPTLFTEVPTKSDINKYVKFENVTLTANATFTTSSATNATMVVNGTNVTLRNNFKLAATLSKDKAYNLVGFVAIYNSTIQVYFLSATEYVAPEPCTLATPVNWDEKISVEANSDKWYLMNLTSAIEAGQDLVFNLVNNSADSVVVTVEAHDACPTDEFTLIQSSTQTIKANTSKSKVMDYLTYLEGQVEEMYIHVITKGGALDLGMETAKYTVTVTAENGTVAGAGTFEDGDTITLTATPAEGYEFVNWTKGEEVVSTENPYTFVLAADVALVANFKQAAPATETVYFINTKKWTKVNVYAWDPVNNASWPGAAATKEAEQIAGYDVYSFTANAGAHKNVIFNNGSAQTPDLVWTAGKYYVMDMGWMTKEEAEAKLATPIPDVWTVVGAKGLLGTDWNLNDANNNMTLQADGTYQLVKTDIVLAAGNYDYKAAKDHAWTTSVPQSGNQTLKITTSGTYDVTFVLNVSAKKLTATATLKQEEVIIPTIQLAGDMTSWGDAPVTLVMAADSLTATATIKLDAKTYEFKMIVGGNWQSDAKTVNRDNNSTVFTGANSDTNTKLVADQAGDYIFTWTYETKTLTVTYPEKIEWIPMDLEIANLVTEVMEVEGAKYLLLQGRDDMNDADVMLFLNNYADVDDDYEVNTESSFMTFGGLELTVLEGVMTQTSETEKGTIYTGTVRASVEEEGETMYVEFALTMYAAPATVLVLTDAIVAIDEELGTLTFNVPTGDGEGYYAELAGYTAPGVHEGPQICLFMTPEAVAYTNYAETSVADGIITLKGEFVSPMGAKFDVTISGKLPQTEPVVKPEPTYTENNLNTYAFGLESELNDTALVVTYRLNNSNATSVNVLVYKGENVVATVAGTTTIGVNTVAIPVANLPKGRMLTWSVEVNGTSVEVPTQDEKMFNLYCPHGLAIDTDPESENFGRILVAEAMQGVPASGYVTSGKGAGLYVFNPSFTTDSVAYKGGNDFTRILASNGYQPWRVKISEDGRIFVSSLDINGVVVWEVSKDLQTWTPVIAGTNDATDYNIYDADGNFVAGLNCSMDVIGSGEDLKLLLYSTNNKGIAFNQSGYRLDEYALGTATTWTGAPKNILEGGKLGLVHTNVEFIYDGEGGYWFGASRAGNAGQPNLVHINAAGEQDYYTEDASLYGGDGVLVHNGMLFKGKARTSGTVGNFGVWTIGKDADGKVTLTEKWSVVANGIGRNLNEFAVDPAENLYVVGNSGEKIIAYALPYSGQVVTPAAAKYAFHIGELLPDPAVVAEMVGVVKRAVQNGESTIVLTHETDGTPHIYEVTNGTILELLQNGVIAVDPENAGDLLAISDIAVTEDGKLVAINYMVTQSDDTRVDAGYKRGETRIYLWNDLHDAPSILFTSKMSSNWFRSKQGLTMAVKGTSDNMEIFTTGIHATSAWARVSSYRVIDGVYEEPAVNHNDHYFFYDINDAIALETTVGTEYELSASPLGAMNWILDANLINPVEIVEPETNNIEITTSVALTEDLGKKFNGASYVTVGEKVLMVAPYATPEGKLIGVEILDITGGLDAAQYVDQLFIDEAVEATAAATAVEVVEGDEATALLITLVADATIYSLEATLANGPVYQVYEDEITNLTIDLENLILIGGPSNAFQVDVYLILDQDNGDGTYTLSSESAVAVLGSDATFVEGYAYDIDAYAPAAKAVVRCMWNGMALELHLNMTAQSVEPIVVVVENATVEMEKIEIFEGTYEYALTMSGKWTDAEGLEYPVLVEIPVYYPESTESYEIMSTVTVGGWGDDENWLGFAEGYLTITTANKVVTATGLVENPYAGVAIDITISGELIISALEDINTTVAPVKVIKNGQLIITKDGVEYNAQGAVVK